MSTICNSLSVSPAVWALAGVIIGGIVSGLFNIILQRNQFKHNKELFLLQNKSAEQVKEILLEMLNNKNYVDRSFEALKGKIGGYSDDELRKILLEVGALKSIRNEDNSEWWYLKERRDERHKH